MRMGPARSGIRRLSDREGAKSASIYVNSGKWLAGNTAGNLEIPATVRDEVALIFASRTGTPPPGPPSGFSTLLSWLEVYGSGFDLNNRVYMRVGPGPAVTYSVSGNSFSRYFNVLKGVKGVRQADYAQAQYTGGKAGLLPNVAAGNKPAIFSVAHNITSFQGMNLNMRSKKRWAWIAMDDDGGNFQDSAAMALYLPEVEGDFSFNLATSSSERVANPEYSVALLELIPS